MAVTYTLIDTEDLGHNQTRVIRAYNVSAIGVAFNVYVELTMDVPYKGEVKQRLVDEEIFVPGITVAGLSGAYFTVIDTVVLDAGQKRIIRELAIGGSSIISIVNTLDFKEGDEDRTIVKSERVYWQG